VKYVRRSKVSAFADVLVKTASTAKRQTEKAFLSMILLLVRRYERTGAPALVAPNAPGTLVVMRE
jgi:hypothetical protein